jgi:hypothetical protein
VPPSHILWGKAFWELPQQPSFGLVLFGPCGLEPRGSTRIAIQPATVRAVGLAERRHPKHIPRPPEGASARLFAMGGAMRYPIRAMPTTRS